MLRKKPSNLDERSPDDLPSRSRIPGGPPPRPMSGGPRPRSRIPGGPPPRPMSGGPPPRPMSGRPPPRDPIPGGPPSRIPIPGGPPPRPISEESRPRNSPPGRPKPPPPGPPRICAAARMAGKRVTATTTSIPSFLIVHVSKQKNGGRQDLLYPLMGDIPDNIARSKAYWE